MIRTYADFVLAVNTQVEALSAVGSSLLNSTGRALLDADVKISLMADFYACARDFLEAVNLAEELTQEEYEAARFVIRALERVGRSEKDTLGKKSAPGSTSSEGGMK